MDNLINIAFKNRHLCYYISSYNLLLLYVLYIWTIFMKYPSDILFICFSFCYMWGLALTVELGNGSSPNCVSVGVLSQTGNKITSQQQVSTGHIHYKTQKLHRLH